MGGVAAERRTLRFASLDDIVRDAERVLSPGAVQLGAWTPAQNVQHVARGIRLGVDGYGAFKPNLVLRLVGPMLKTTFLKKTFRAGTKAPGGLGEMIKPDADATPEAAMAELVGVVGDVASRGFIERNPVVGVMSHEEWVTLQCRHAELHFSFIVPVA